MATSIQFAAGNRTQYLHIANTTHWSQSNYIAREVARIIVLNRLQWSEYYSSVARRKCFSSETISIVSALYWTVCWPCSREMRWDRYSQTRTYVVLSAYYPHQYLILQCSSHYNIQHLQCFCLLNGGTFFLLQLRVRLCEASCGCYVATHWASRATLDSRLSKVANPQSCRRTMRSNKRGGGD